MDGRMFHLGDILSVTDGRLVSPRHIEGVYDILNYMTGNNLFTHQLPRAARLCEPELLRQHPQLAALIEPDTELDADSVPAWLEKQVESFGEYLMVEPLATYQHREPISELVEQVGVERVIVLGAEPERN